MGSEPKTGLDMATAAAERRIAEWRTRECSVCGYETGYVFADGSVGFDAGCHCTGRYIVEPRTWDDVANYYNWQTAPGVRARFAAFWGFDD